MKKIVIAILVVVAFCWISVVSAENRQVKESPESIVWCLSALGTHLVQTRSLPETINVEKCRIGEPDRYPDPCAPCIISLEEQGCEIIDVNVAHVTESGLDTSVTYVLSCDGR
jgi:hypothetical protein